ncbi:COQ9 family protein [Candidatus Bandiella euplotis]|uniref:COQ9 family ubiquinone synthesis protein n=1 Tax=Candidatus Bandiella euplotis TaxID=1664265 RepID=A0ABZ0UQ57_9RICK|nr:COQ9 family protein [Candidatus Bandiella woodruffii]WPX96140.1 COQ9 family ubiquinone synthesis protein [Candidatus Bandiella woodruffii]
MTEHISHLKQKVLSSVIGILPYEPFDGNIISKACADMGLEPQYGDLLFPNGRMGVLEMFRDSIDQQMTERVNNELEQINSITSRIYEAIKIRLEILAEYKIAISKINTFFSTPWNHHKLYPYTWHSINLIWRVAGKDKSTDFNYYTKRGLLTAIYLSTVLYWISDDSEDFSDTQNFLRRKLRLVGKIGGKIHSLRRSRKRG